MQQRLQKCISEAGVASRRTAEAMISAGRVTVNGRTAQLGAQADPETDVICIDGRPLPPRAPKRYIMLNKPRGYVTTSVGAKRWRSLWLRQGSGCIRSGGWISIPRACSF